MKLTKEYVCNAAKVLACIIGDKLADDLRKEPASGVVYSLPTEKETEA